MLFKTTLVASLAAAVSAHQNFHQFWVNDVTPGYQVGIRMPPSNSPVTDVTSDDIACNVNGDVVPSGVQTVDASAGDSITVQWDASNHPGPITHFLYGPVDNASLATGVGAGWIKINEWDRNGSTWASNIMDEGNMTYTFPLPADLTSGEYLLRSEMLALHGSQVVGGAQFYIGCAQLKITGPGGSCSPSISLPGAYNATQDNIYIPDIYYGFNISTYSAPGGSVASCTAGTASTLSGGAAPTAAATTTGSSSAVATTSAVASSSAAPASSAATSTPVASSSAAAVTSSAVASSSAVAASSVASSSAASVTTAALPASATVSAATSATSSAAAATSTSTDSSSISLTGMSVTELLDLFKQVLLKLFTSSSTTSKARRHARDIRA